MMMINITNYDDVETRQQHQCAPIVKFHVYLGILIYVTISINLSSPRGAVTLSLPVRQTLMRRRNKFNLRTKCEEDEHELLYESDEVFNQKLKINV